LNPPRALSLAEVRTPRGGGRHTGGVSRAAAPSLYRTSRVPCSLVLRVGPHKLTTDAQLAALDHARAVLAGLSLPPECAILTGDASRPLHHTSLQILDVSLSLTKEVPS